MAHDAMVIGIERARARHLHRGAAQCTPHRPHWPLG
jgi:hypothetical protein